LVNPAERCYYGVTIDFVLTAMSTTSLKLPEDLKLQAAEAARDRGMTTHAFMVEAIRVAAQAAQQRADFVGEARAAREAMLASGRGYAPDDVHAYLRQRIQGKAARQPSAKSWQK
jgi:hypothetical protein